MYSDAMDRRILALQHVFGVMAPAISCGDDHPLGERLLAGSGKERVDVSFLERMVGEIKFALNRAITASIGFAGHEVDTSIWTTAPVGPFRPEPYIAELIGV